MMEERFWAAFRRIGSGRAVGVRRLAWLPDPYRFLLVDPHWIIWRAREGQRVVVAILHSRRDIPRLLRDLA